MGGWICAAARFITPATGTQIDLAAWVRDLDAECKRVRAVNGEGGDRGWLVVETDPSKGVDLAEWGREPAAS